MDETTNTTTDPQLDPLPEDLTALSDDELVELDSRLATSFDELFEAGTANAEQVARLEALAQQIESVRGEHDRRTNEAAEATAAAEAIAARVRPSAEGDTPDGETPEGDESAPEGEQPPAEAEATPPAEPAAAPAAAPAPVPVAATVEPPAAVPAPPEPIAAAATEPAQPRRHRRLNVPLAEMAARAPRVDVGNRSRELVITAAADVPGFAVGGRMNDVDDIARGAWGRARHLPVTAHPSNAGGWDGQGGMPVATIERTHDLVLSYDMAPEQIVELFEPYRQVEALVAAGGWCALSEILYELFNISDADSLIDLPTAGIRRGGIRFPVSASLADVLSSVWLWTETNDILAVTGAGVKPCARVTCPDFGEERLEAHGICVTAGNLTDSAYPESTRNFIKLLMDAHAHVMNARHIAQMVAASSAVSVTSPADGATANLLAAVELQAIDYREKFGMRDDAVLEVALPRWTDGVVRADLSRRSGVDLLSVSDEQIRGWFDERDVRAQFVADWQSRAAGFPGQASALLAWPATVNFLLYAAGTFVKGEGPTIDLGVVRDSVLNAKNDHTAAWSEETTLIAKLGHESRNVQVAICPDGVTGAGVNAACPIA